MLGQIVVAKFNNPAGLEKVGENLFTTTLNSGEFDGVGEDITASSYIICYRFKLINSSSIVSDVVIILEFAWKPLCVVIQIRY